MKMMRSRDLLWASAVFLAWGCSQAPAPPSHDEALAAVQAKIQTFLGHVQDQALESAKFNRQLAAGVHMLDGPSNLPSEADVEREVRSNHDQMVKALKLTLGSLGPMNKADLVAPGSQNPFWPVDVTYDAPEVPKFLQGTFFIYRDASGRWTGKANSLTTMVGGTSQPLPKERLHELGLD